MSHSKLANIHPHAKIGKNVTIDSFATVEEDTVIGDDCWIGSSAIIWRGARLGKNIKVYPGASVSSDPQDLKYRGENTETLIGDNVSIREYVTISRGTGDGKTIIENDSLLMAYVHIAHDCTVGQHAIIANAVQIGGHVTIGKWAILGGGSVVHQFTKIGNHSMIGGGLRVVKDVPPYAMAGKEPLSYVGVNTVGLKRNGFAKEKITQIQHIYSLIFLKGLNNSDALKETEKKIDTSEERDYIIDFISSSERGIIPYGK